MNTPVADFVRAYASSGISRLHMPGHKGNSFLGCEALDITEIAGADALYEAEGILAESEQNAAGLFGSGRTLFSTEGSSHCIKAMLYLAVTGRPAGSRPLVLAARNVHKAFLYAAALLDFEIQWLWPEGESRSLCSCPVTPQALERALASLPAPPAAVYVTSPDYLGGRMDIGALALVCRRYGTILAVDNAHGAYLHFLTPPVHPVDLGADLCCDSAHKTLPVLTGGAYLHIGKHAPAVFRENAKSALAVFGSTSPSYLTLASLDLCNAYLADGYPERLSGVTETLNRIRKELTRRGWHFLDSDPLRLTFDLTHTGITGPELAARLRRGGVECEYADPEFLVLMATPENTENDFRRLMDAVGENPVVSSSGSDPSPDSNPVSLTLSASDPVLSVRQALFAPHETIPVEQARGRICGAPAVSCPPAIPIAVSGERIGTAALELFRHYHIETVDVVKDRNV